MRSYFGQGFEQGSDDYFYTRDHLGSVREVVGSDGTTVASRLSYDPWGKVTETGSGALTDFAFTGHHFDRPSGLGLTWWRGYDPNLGRWLSTDPIGLEGGLNLYGYVNNDPTNFIDAFGTDSTEPPCDHGGSFRYPIIPGSKCMQQCSESAGAAADKCNGDEACIQAVRRSLCHCLNRCDACVAK